MYRLIESIEKPLQVKSGKNLTGPFTVLGVFNQNGRRYPEDVYEGAYQDLIPKIRDRRLLGELDHPQDYDEVRLSTVSHVITECHIVEKNGRKTVYGTVELLDTPSGKIAQALVKAGIPLGISSRAVGNTKKVSEGVEVTQLKLITYDLVAEPSFATAILSEEKKSELNESLSLIESRLPMNEGKTKDDTIRDSINRIRESLCLSETESESEIHIDESKESQTLEISALRRILESKTKTISKDTERLKESRRVIKSLRDQLSDREDRYNSLLENHRRLQDSYNSVVKSKKLEENSKITAMNAEIVELRKRLAVERRGMSYEQVSSLLEGVSSEKDIETKLDMLSSMRKRSNVASRDSLNTLNESILPSGSYNKLSSIISKV